MWKSWDAPTPPPDLVDSVVHRLEREGGPRLRAVRGREKRHSRIPLRHAIAAVLVIGAAISAARMWPSAPPAAEPDPVPTSGSDPGSIPTTVVSYRSGPSGPPTGSFDPTRRFYATHAALQRQQPRKGHVLRRAKD